MKKFRGKAKPSTMSNYKCSAMDYIDNHKRSIILCFNPFRRQPPFIDSHPNVTWQLLFHIDIGITVWTTSLWCRLPRKYDDIPNKAPCNETLCGHPFSSKMCLTWLILLYGDCSRKRVSGLKPCTWCSCGLSRGIFFLNCILQCHCKLADLK